MSRDDKRFCYVGSMVQTQRKRSSNPVAFKRLMRLGNVSMAEGNAKQAHEYWQQAALMQPDNEEVWQALLRVLSSVDDRRVCLRNILTINPKNKQAQQMLDDLVGDTQPEEVVSLSEVSPRQKQIARLIDATQQLVASALIGVLIAIFLLAVRFFLM